MHPRLPLLLLASALLAAHSPLTAASLRTIAGTGVKGFSGDGGPANAAQINNPFGVVRGPDGNLWFCEYGGQRIRTISSSGTIRTVAGNGQTGYTGDGGPATAASLNQPHEIRFDRAGDLYIVDMQNHAVRKIVLSTGLITTIVGTGKPGYSGDGGPATAAQLNQPHRLQLLLFLMLRERGAELQQGNILCVEGVRVLVALSDYGLDCVRKARSLFEIFGDHGQLLVLFQLWDLGL